MKKCLLLFFVVTTILISVNPVSAEYGDELIAEDKEETSESIYSEIRAKYRSLVIEDSSVRDLERWNRVEADLRKFILGDESDEVYRPRALYLLGRLCEQRSQVSNSDDDREKALKAFDEIVDSYSSDNFADESLLAIARINERQGNLFEAKEALTKIIGSYGSTDSAPHAQKQFTLLEEKFTAQDKAQEVEVVPSDRLTNEMTTIGSLEERSALVLIDPGHGGEEDGALGPDGIQEKNVTLAVSRMVRDRLRETGRVRVQLTRTGDETLKLSDRTNQANEIKADIFVSIHANASEYKSSRGVETYYLDNTNDKSSLRLAERENLVTGGESRSALSFIISDFIQSVKMDDSISLAHLTQDSIVASLKKKYPKIKDLGVKRAPFYVLVGAHMPCILTEISFIDHPEEGVLLSTTKYQQLVADGIFQGIVSFLEKKGRY